MNSWCGVKPVSRDLLLVNRDVHSAKTGELAEDCEDPVDAAPLSTGKVCSDEVERKCSSKPTDVVIAMSPVLSTLNAGLSHLFKLNRRLGVSVLGDNS